MSFHENYDEGSYCATCDESLDQDEFVIVPIDQWTEHYACPQCGHVETKIMHSDAYYGLGFYLLSIVDDDLTWPEFVIPLPRYEADAEVH